jgi:hypothetical protein
MAGIHVFMRSKGKSWMAGSSPAMTTSKVPVQQRTHCILPCAPGHAAVAWQKLGRIKPRREKAILFSPPPARAARGGEGLGGFR